MQAISRVGVIFLFIIFCIAAIILFSFSSSETAEKTAISAVDQMIEPVAEKDPTIVMEIIEQNSRIRKFQAKNAHGSRDSLSFGFVLQQLEAGNQNIIRELTAAILQPNFSAVFWECVPVSFDTLSSTAFEFVVVDAPVLAGILEADIEPFSQKFSDIQSDISIESSSVTSFTNIGGDSLLVVPTPYPGAADRGITAHLAAYLRGAPVNRIVSLWKKVGKSMLEVLQSLPSSQKRWLSTSGAGVSWLHVRIDSAPKYYTYHPYRQI